MSNETDLDWLALNVHVWTEITPQSIPTGDRTFEHGCTFYENHICIYHKEFASSIVIYKNQWLARRAELHGVTERFNPFTSIEDNQEQEMKQDNRWFERGELPPVGVECEAKKYGKEEWYKVVICGAGKHLGLAVAFYEKQKGSDAFTCSSAEYFRPIRTEREVAIEEMQSDIAERWANCEELAKYLVEKGWVKAGK